MKTSTIVALTQASANTPEIRTVSAPCFSINLTKIKAGEVEKWLEEKIENGDATNAESQLQCT